MNTKKIVALLLLIALCFTPLFANGKQEVAQEKEKMHFVYVSPLLSHPVWLIAKQGFDQACEEMGVQGDWVGPQGISAEEMAQLVDTAVAQNADGIITQSICPTEPINNAINSGIPLILVDGDKDDVDGKLAFLGKDFHRQAELFYEYVTKRIGMDKKIVLSMQCAALNAQVYIDQNDAIIDVFSKHPGGFELTNISMSEGDKAKSLIEWQNSLNTYPEVNVAISCCAEGAAPCCAVVEELGRKDQIITLGVDDIKENLDLVEAGKLNAICVSSFFNYGYQAAYWLMQNITENREPVEKTNDAGTYLVTKENLDTYQTLLHQKVDLPAAK